jgi:hypothetical protein
MKKQIVKVSEEDLQQNEGAEVLAKKFNDRLNHEETSAIIKIVWSYMVFVTAARGQQEHSAQENRHLWDKLAALLQSKVRFNGI